MEQLRPHWRNMVRMRPKNARVLVEVAVDSVAGAQAAAANGADRLELCADLLEGGITPSLGLLCAVRVAVAIPVFAMVRPRGGDFCYDEGEFDAMRRDVAFLRAHGADGIVTGCLRPDGALDGERMAALRELAGSLALTCHRAFDLCADPVATLAELRRLGVDRVLTSGQAKGAPLGARRIAEFVASSGGSPVIMAGAGVRAENVAELVRVSGCREVHLSATAWRSSAMTFRREGVPMGTATPPGEYDLRRTDGAEVARVRGAVLG
jgi:copper homeostasis protein